MNVCLSSSSSDLWKFGIAKEALIEIGSRLKTRCLRDVSTRGEAASVRPLPGFGPPEDLRSGGFPLSSTTAAGSSGRYERMLVCIFCITID